LRGLRFFAAARAFFDERRFVLFLDFLLFFFAAAHLFAARLARVVLREEPAGVAVGAAALPPPAAGSAPAAARVPGTPSAPSGSRNELCMKRDGVAFVGVPDPPYGTGLHAVAVSTLPVTGLRCSPLVQYPRTPPPPLTHATPRLSTCTSCT
jgi:hypothetical protein